MTWPLAVINDWNHLYSCSRASERLVMPTEQTSLVVLRPVNYGLIDTLDPR